MIPYMPLDNYVSLRCDIKHLPFKFRRCFRKIEGLLIEASDISRKLFRLVVLDDGCFLLDVTYNKIVWHYDYFNSMAVLNARLTELLKFCMYEKKFNQTQIEYNHYKTLSKLYEYGNEKRNY